MFNIRHNHDSLQNMLESTNKIYTPRKRNKIPETCPYDANSFQTLIT